MTAQKVVLIGLDACDPALAQKFAANGVMPNLAKLLETGVRAPVQNPYGLFVGSTWLNFFTSVRPDRHGFHCWSRIHPHNYEFGRHRPDIADLPQFWAQIGEAGRRVAAIDVPHTIAVRPINGIQISEWGCHDKHHGFHSYPKELCRDIEARFGLHPALKGEAPYEAIDTAPDDWVHREGALRTQAEDVLLLKDMLAGLETKRKMLTALMKESDWDLFVGVFGETHAIGHQQWHLHDPRHPRHDPETVKALGGDPLAQVYGAIDRGLGDLQKLAPPGALFLVYLSHGMGPHYDGDHLLEAILTSLEQHGRVGPPDTKRRLSSTGIKNALRSAGKLMVPPPLRPYVRGIVGRRPPPSAERRARQRFFQEPNNTVYSGVRLNLAGREPRGIVQPHEVEALIAEITEGLLEIRNLDTGKPIIRGVEPCDRWHKRKPDDAMPDLFVDWERSAPVTNIASPRIGTVHKAYDNWRTGDHRLPGMLLAKGAGLAAGARMPKLAAEDIGPSIAAAMGVEIHDVDGVAAKWLAQAGSGRPAAKVQRGAMPAAR